MNRANGRRILFGGAVAALVLIVGEIIAEPVVGSVSERWLQQLGLPLPGTSAMIILVALALVVGLVLVWLYTAFRPRYGAGMHTAVLAGLTVWALNCFVPNVAMFAYGALSTDLFWIATLHQLVVVPAAAVVGAWLYQKGKADARRVHGHETSPATSQPAMPKAKR